MKARARIIVVAVAGVLAFAGVAPSAHASNAPATKTQTGGARVACAWVTDVGACVSNPTSDLPVEVPKLPRPPVL